MELESKNELKEIGLALELKKVNWKKLKMEVGLKEWNWPRPWPLRRQTLTVTCSNLTARMPRSTNTPYVCPHRISDNLCNDISVG